MNTRSIVVVGVLAYAAFLVVLVPASFVADRITAATQRHVAIADAGGTLWNGAARIRFTVAGGWLDLDSLEWHFVPARLLAGRLAFDAKASAPGLEASAQIGRGLGDWELRNGAASASVASLATLAPVAAQWRPEGRLAATIPSWRWNDRSARGEATVEWRDAAVSLSEVKPLGTYRVVATGNGETAQLALSTIAGALQVSGKGSAGPAELRLSGEARSDPAMAKALEPLLDLMGPRRPDGSRALELRVAM